MLLSPCRGWTVDILVSVNLTVLKKWVWWHSLKYFPFLISYLSCRFMMVYLWPLLIKHDHCFPTCLCILYVGHVYPLCLFQQGCCYDSGANYGIPSCFYAQDSYLDFYFFGHGHGSSIHSRMHEHCILHNNCKMLYLYFQMLPYMHLLINFSCTSIFLLCRLQISFEGIYFGESLCHILGWHYYYVVVLYLQVAGRIPLPPRYAFGIFYSRYWAYNDIGEMVRQCS